MHRKASKEYAQMAKWEIGRRHPIGNLITNEKVNMELIDTLTVWPWIADRGGQKEIEKHKGKLVKCWCIGVMDFICDLKVGL
jgi:hypothetical protein